MRIKPILFSPPMVREILDGRKTMTRRVVKPQPDRYDSFEGLSDDMAITKIDRYGEEYQQDVPGLYATFIHDGIPEFAVYKCPWEVGDILWVRESWAEMPYGYLYHADYPNEVPEDFDPDDRWKLSMFMPKAACRIFLRVKDIRVERLQDITPAECEAEGAREYGFNSETGEIMPSTNVLFHILWDEIYSERDGGAYAWDKNPWVWVITFERTERPNGWPEWSAT